MKSNVLISKYRILVVTDPSNPSQIALQNAVNLAKTIDGSIKVFDVKPPTQVVRNVNQLSAMRELNEERNRTRRKLSALVDQIAETERIPIIYDFAFGNVIYEVQEHINKTQPDIVVLEKSKPKVNGLLGTDLTSYLMKNFKGTLLISGDEKPLRHNNDIALGIIDDVHTGGVHHLTEDLERKSANPITLFKIKSANQVSVKEIPSDHKEEDTNRSNMTTFEFDQGVNFSKSVSKYVEKRGINLLCVRRSRLLDLNKSIKSVTKQIQKTVQKADIPVLILDN